MGIAGAGGSAVRRFEAGSWAKIRRFDGRVSVINRGAKCFVWAEETGSVHAAPVATKSLKKQLVLFRGGRGTAGL